MATNQPPSRKSRAECWNARDKFFKCLDSQGLWLIGLRPESNEEVLNIDARMASPNQNAALKGSHSIKAKSGVKLIQCVDEHKEFCVQCLPSWVDHFCKLRVKDLQTDSLAKNEFARLEARQVNEDEFWNKVRRKKDDN